MNEAIYWSTSGWFWFTIIVKVLSFKFESEEIKFMDVDQKDWSLLLIRVVPLMYIITTRIKQQNLFANK